MGKSQKKLGRCSCERCLNLYRKRLMVRIPGGYELETNNLYCQKRGICITYPIDDCSDYIDWKETKK